MIEGVRPPCLRTSSAKSSSCQARIFLHTNGSEIDIRCHVTQRKISDAVIKAETVVMLAIAFWDYFGARLQVANQPDIQASQPSSGSVTW
jgi:hypothetical protein